MAEKEKPNLTLEDGKNKYFLRLLKHNWKYLSGLILLISGIIFISNFVRKKPLLAGGESCYHLLHLQGIIPAVPENWWVAVPIILSLAFVILALGLAKKLDLPRRETTIFLAILILTPAFILPMATLSAYLLAAVLSLAGLILLSQKHRKIKWLSLILFLLATCVDFFSSLFLVAVQIIYLSNYADKSEKSHFLKKWLIPIITGLVALFGLIFLKTGFFIGPFHRGQVFADLISDLGGYSGIGFFVLIFALIGLMMGWKKRFPATIWIYVLSLGTIFSYFLNTEMIFYLSLIGAYFAALGLIAIFDRPWALETVKKFTLFIVILGIVFSTLTYLDRVSEYPPRAGEPEALSWIKANTPEESIIFTLPESSDYTEYFSQRKTFYQLRHPLGKGREAKIKESASEIILNSTYMDITSPILDQNNISLIYLPPGFRQTYPAEQGLLFLLKNEKFKLVHSTEGAEVWVYQKE